MDSNWVDSTNSAADSLTVRGAPGSSLCGNYCDSLAKITVKAKRPNFDDSISVTTYLFVETP